MPQFFFVYSISIYFYQKAVKRKNENSVAAKASSFRGYTALSDSICLLKNINIL